MRELTTISVSKKMMEKLKSLGRKGETYEQILQKLLEAYEKERRV